MLGHYGRAARSVRWAPVRVIGAIPLCRGVPGARRCPQASARAAAAAAVFSDQARGPSRAQR
eukprot:3863224-Lingulodinium_polyedra.AAC.1